MAIKRKLLFSIFGSGTLFILALIIIKIFLDSSFRNRLPGNPDYKSISKPVQEQISDANKKAFHNPTANNLGRLGLVYYSNAFYDKAAECYKMALKRNSRKWIWSYYLGYLNLEQGELNSSVDNFRTVVGSRPNNYMAMFYMGEACQNLGLQNEAESIFKKIRAMSPTDSDGKNIVMNNIFPINTYAMYRLARIYMDSNRLDSAEFLLKEIIKNQMTFGPAYRLLGNVYSLKGDSGLNNKFKIRANDLVDYAPPSDNLIDQVALLSRSDIYLLKQIDDAIRSNNFLRSVELCNHALKFLPDNKYVISNIMCSYFNLNQDQKALPFIEKHFKYFEEDYVELINVADVLFDRGFDVMALKYFNQAEKLRPENSKLALWLSERGMRKEALILLKEQLKTNPDDIKILNDAIYLLHDLGEKEMATNYFNNLSRLSPANPEVKKFAGMIEEEKGNLEGAISNYEKALKSDPKDLNINKYLASFYIKYKFWDKALKHYNLALKNYPNEPVLLEGLGKLLITCPEKELRNTKEGLEYSERAFINFKSSLHIRTSAGRNIVSAYALLGDKKNASKYMKLTIDLASKGNSLQDYVNYFESLRKIGNIPE